MYRPFGSPSYGDGAVNERGATIDLYNADGQGGKSFPPSKILEALKRAEQNKTPQ